MNLHFLKMYSKVIVNNCKGDRDFSTCYGEKLSQINQLFGFKQTIKLLQIIQDKDPQINKCHSIAHKIAQNEVRKNPDNWLDFFKQLEDPYMCFTGFIHGAVEGKKGSDSQLVLKKPLIEKMCRDIVDATNQKNPYPCGHGLGHIILVEQEADLNKSIQICKSLSDGIRRGCLDGLFMEFLLKTNLTEHGLVWPQEITPAYVQKMETTCANYQGKIAESCWREMSQGYYMIHGPDLLKLKNNCQKGVVKENIMACYFRSFNFALIDNNFDHSQLSQLCTDYLNNPDDIYNCYDWAITGLILTSPKYIPMINDLCNKAPSSFTNECWSMKDKRMKMYSSPKTLPVS